MDEKGVSWLKGSCIAESRLDVQTAFCYTKLMNFSFMLNPEVSLAFNSFKHFTISCKTFWEKERL